MTFLLQLYAPKDDLKYLSYSLLDRYICLMVFFASESAFHRMLYVFVCTNGSCVKGTVLCQDAYVKTGSELRKPSMAVFRMQLPKDNAFYDSDSKNPEICYKKPSGTFCSSLFARGALFRH